MSVAIGGKKSGGCTLVFAFRRKNYVGVFQLQIFNYALFTYAVEETYAADIPVWEVAFGLFKKGVALLLCNSEI